ncbi:MAG TPA: retropepsin-like aspartic protease [Terracidiphilus sp.]
MASLALVAQQAPPPPPNLQEPGGGSQVHTGTSSGLSGDARIQNLLADHQFFRVQSELEELPPEQAQLYRGILANRNNDPKESIKLLEPLVDKIASSGDAVHEKLARKALAEDYLRDGEFSKAAKEYQSLEARLDEVLTPDEKDEIELPLKLAPLAAANPPMTVDPCNGFVLQVSRNPLGLTDIPVFVDARPHSWMLDPTAPFNLIARSLAREVGLKVSDQGATIHTLTGKPMQVHSTVIPRFTVGGRLAFHNMTAFVFEDADYNFAQTKYQVQGVLGYPALSALSSLTFTDNATVEFRPARKVQAPAEAAPNYEGARFFVDGDQIIVALGLAPNEQMFAVDAAGQQTYFSSRYYDEHAKDFAGQKPEPFTVPGPRVFPPQPAYQAETVPLQFGSAKVDVHFVEMLTQPVGSAALDDVYGVLGVDALDQFRSYTFDYANMRFRVGQN